MKLSARRARASSALLATLLVVVPTVASCTTTHKAAGSSQANSWVTGETAAPRVAATGSAPLSLLPGMPAPLRADDLYAADRPNALSPVVRHDRPLVYEWQLPGRTSPDMGGVSADGKVLWLSGRYNNEVYAIDTTNGHLLARIKVGKQPHGLCVWPQPGRYSLGHTGILR